MQDAGLCSGNWFRRAIPREGVAPSLHAPCAETRLTVYRAHPSSSLAIKIKEFVSVYIKANVPMLGGTYIKAGYSEVDVIVNESMASGNTYGDVSTDGFVAAIGYQYDMDMGLSIRAEVMAHQFEDVKTDNGIAASSGTSANGGRNVVSVGDMMGARGTISIVKSF